jgi:predicted ribosomally synthesized peptide with nif11-like leader
MRSRTRAVGDCIARREAPSAACTDRQRIGYDRAAGKVAGATQPESEPMSIDAFKAFMVKVQQDEGLRDALRSAGSDGVPLSTLVRVAEAHGFRFEAWEVESELSDAALDGIVGGTAAVHHGGIEGESIEPRPEPRFRF